jgi:hypothetical protein
MLPQRYRLRNSYREIIASRCTFGTGATVGCFALLMAPRFAAMANVVLAILLAFG